MDIVKFLIANGANVNVIDNDEHMALVLTIMHENDKNQSHQSTDTTSSFFASQRSIKIASEKKVHASQNCENEMICSNRYDTPVEQTDVQFVFKIHDNVVKIPAKKANLIATSPIFSIMFNGLTILNEVEIVNASPAAFKEFLQLFDGNDTDLTMENISIVLMLIDYYKAISYHSKCVRFLMDNLKVDDILWGFHLAIKFNIDDLKSHCSFMTQTNYKKVLERFNLHKNGELCLSSWNHHDEIELENILPYVLIALKNHLNNESQSAFRFTVMILIVLLMKLYLPFLK